MMPSRPSHISETELASSLSDDRLHLIIFPTEQCNFRCVYCYEDFAIGTMKPAVVEGVKRLLALRVPSLRKLHLSWFGGEPMVALRVIEDIAGFAKSLSSVAQNDVVYVGEMTTNGYLLNLENATRLVELGTTHFQISLDGPKEFHDATRIKRNGEGSFDTIWGNLCSIRSSAIDINVLLRLHLTPTNAPAMPDFVRKIQREFLGDSRFTVLLKPVNHWGGPNDSKFHILSGSKRAETVNTLTALLYEARPEGNYIYKPGNVCYAARPNSLVIRATGEIGKCTLALSDPANNIGQLHPDGTLTINNEALRPWFRSWNGQDTSGLACPLMGLPRPSGPTKMNTIGVRPSVG
jgi:uncharacterized protein